MVINWYGEGAFKIQSGEITILTDPFESSVGLTAPRFKADIIIKTKDARDYHSVKEAEGKNIVGPGEYEIRGIEVNGFPAGGEAAFDGGEAVYMLQAEGLRLGILGEISSSDLSEEATENLSHLDILFMPCGGTPYLEPEAAAKLAKKLEPRIIIPCFFKIPDLKRSAKEVTAFEKEIGLKPEALTPDQKAEPPEKLTVKAKDLTWTGTKLVVLKP